MVMSQVFVNALGPFIKLIVIEGKPLCAERIEADQLIRTG